MALLPRAKYTEEEMEQMRREAIDRSRQNQRDYDASEQAALTARLHNEGGINDGMPAAPQPNLDLRQRGLYVPQGQPGALSAGTPTSTQPRMIMGGAAGETMPLTNQQFASGVLRGMANQGGRVMVPQASGLVTNTPLFTSATPAANAPTGITPEMKYRAGLGSNIERNKYAEQQRLDARMGNELKIREAVNARKLAEKVMPAEIAGQASIAAAMVGQGVDPKTGQPLPGANQPEDYARGDDGVWRGVRTGKPAPDHVTKRLEREKVKADDVERARGLTPPAKSAWYNPFSRDDVWGMDRETGEFKNFGSQKELDRNRKTHVPLTPEQLKAMEEGPRGGGAQGPSLSTAMPQQAAPTPAAGAKASDSFVRASVLNLQSPEEKKKFILNHLRLGSITKEQARQIAIENGLQ